MMYSIQKNYIPIKTAEQIPLECPLCRHVGKISMQFYQLQAETSGGINNTKQVSATCICDNCKTDIPNVKWTKDFHNFYKEQKKSLKISTSFKMKKGGKIALWILVGLFGVIGFFLLFMIIYFKILK
jgi:hypothetical protein